jgi:protein-disulfide isomerase
MQSESWTAKLLLTMIVLVIGGMIHPIGIWAESPSSEESHSLQQQIEALQQGQQAIRDELKAIKELLTARTKRRSPIEDISLTLNVADSPTQGQADAPLTLVEYTDYQCPYCARHSKSVLPQLVKNFIDTGKVRYVLRDFPLTSIHPHAAKAHEAAHCAGDQGKYWELHDRLFAHPKELQADKLAGHATAVGVADATAFQACLDSGKYEAQTKAGVTEGTKIGVRGTPSFALGRTEANGTVKAVKLIRGAQGVPVFEDQIQALLAAKTDKTGKP